MKCVLLNAASGEEVYSIVEPVEVYSPTAAEIEEFFKNLPSEDSADFDRNQYDQLVNVLSKIQPSDSSNPPSHAPSTPSGPAVPSNSSDGSDRSDSSGGSGSSYSVSVPEVAGGKISASPSSARAGQQVAITVTPDNGYVLAELSVVDSKGNALILTDNGGGKYTFTMPSGKITIHASFERAQPSAWNNPFADVSENAWYYEAVRFV